MVICRVYLPGLMRFGMRRWELMKIIAAWILAVFFGGGEGVVGYALSGGVENLIAAPQLGMITFGRRLGGEVVHFGVEQRLLIGREFVFLETA